jgi:hypothetical protein
MATAEEMVMGIPVMRSATTIMMVIEVITVNFAEKIEGMVAPRD